MAAFVYWICISSIQGQVSSWVIFKTFNFKVLQQLTNIFFVTYKTKVVCTKVLWLSRFYSNYQFVSFGGCFWIFGGSNNLDSMFLFSCHCTVSLSAVIVNKKNQGRCSWHCCRLQGHFLPLFFRHNTLTCITPKENEIC